MYVCPFEAYRRQDGATLKANKGHKGGNFSPCVTQAGQKFQKCRHLAIKTELEPGQRRAPLLVITYFGTF